MKRIIPVFFLLCFLFCSSDIFSQVYDRRGQTIYVELMGSGLVYSLNYESRFSQQTGGLGGRIGISYLSDWWTVPININYMFGNSESNKFFELGVGTTYVGFSEPIEDFSDGRSIDDQFMFSTTLMYRYHPRRGKLLFRVGAAPMIGKYKNGDTFVWPWIGISIGRVF